MPFSNPSLWFWRDCIKIEQRMRFGGAKECGLYRTYERATRCPI
jgi:hypothetical protein